MDPEQPAEPDAGHRVRDLRAHVTALRHVVAVPEALHQLVPGPTDADGAPAELGRLLGKAVAGNGRQHEMERVLGTSAVRRRW